MARNAVVVMEASRRSGPAVLRTATGTFTPFGGAGTIAPTVPGSVGRAKKEAARRAAGGGGGGVLGTIGGAIGERLGGSTGRTLGTALGNSLGGSGSKPGSPASGQGLPLTGGSGVCPAGTFKGPAGTCLDLIPGGATSGQGMLVPQVGGGGGLGLGAVAPGIEAVATMRCPPGFILAIDNLCYHKKVLPRQFRKWIPAPKPVLSAADAKTIRRADSLRKKVAGVAKRSGLTVKRK